MSNVNPSMIGDSQNVYAIVDSRYPHRWLDAWGDVEKAKVDSIWRADEFTITATATSPVTASVLPDAVALVTTPATDFAGDNIQLVGSRFKFETGKPCYFGAEITISEATQSGLVVGLFGVDTTLMAASGSHALAVSAGGVGFTKIDAVTACYLKSYRTTVEHNSASVLTMDVAAHIYEIYFDGTAVHGYIDGELVATFTENLPNAVMTPSIEFRTGAAAAETCTIHWMRAFQVRS